VIAGCAFAAACGSDSTDGALAPDGGGDGSGSDGTTESGGSDGGADAADGSTGDGDAGAACSDVGTYELESYFCDATDITAIWKSVIPTTTTVVTSAPDGGCRAHNTYTSASCVESEAIEYPGEGASVAMSFEGIDGCTPAACKFADADAPCVIGDRAAERSGSVTAPGGKLTIEFVGGGNICPAPGKHRLVLAPK
jgi:hypothetical protein